MKVLNFSPSEDVKDNPAFPCLARIMVDMVDLAVGFLGPDLDPLTDDLITLGKRHINYNVPPDLLPAMGPALIYSLHKVLGPRFTAEESESWQVVFTFMISKMVIGLKMALAAQASRGSTR
jgi:hypothetical protein